MLDALKPFMNEVREGLSCIERDLNSLNESVNALNESVNALNGKQDIQDSKQDVLNEKQDTLDSKLVSVNASLHDHKRQAEVDMDQLQTSLNSTLTTTQASLHSLNETLCSKMNEHTEAMDLKLNSHTNTLRETLTATTAQLSTEHQNLQTDISDVECTGSEESLELYQNLTHQLESIQSGVNNIRGQYSCGGHGWRRVVYLDMTDSSTTCPSGWQLTGYSKRTCGRVSTGWHTCDSATFPVSGGEYTRVCGRIKAYQWGVTHAFYNYHVGFRTTIDSAYVTGVSVTHGSPQQHIWTFAAGISEGNPTGAWVCPCDASRDISVPPFVGDDYFCESGVNEAWDGSRHYTFHSTDTLWDGEDCLPSSTCCSQHNPPHFIKQLPTPTTDDIEARVCLHTGFSYGNIAVELVELYVQ